MLDRKLSLVNSLTLGTMAEIAVDLRVLLLNSKDKPDLKSC